MSTQFFPLEACQKWCEEMQASLAASEAHLFTDALTNPEPATPLADYTTAEADYSGYAEQVFTTWFAPILAEGTGYMIQSPWVQFAFAASPGTPTNNIKGMYLLDSDGDLRLTVVFTDLIPMQIFGQGIGFNLTLLWPTGV